MSRRTEEAYLAWIRRFIFLHDKRHPRQDGWAQLVQYRDLSYSLTYAPLGVDLANRPTQRFADRREITSFLAGALKLDQKEIRDALNAVSRHGSYAISGIRLSEKIAKHGLGPVWSCDSAPGSLASH